MLSQAPRTASTCSYKLLVSLAAIDTNYNYLDYLGHCSQQISWCYAASR